MRAIDTNVLVRLMTRDEPRQTAAAERYVSNGAWVSVLALAEAIWVLASVYEIDSSGQAQAIEMLLDHRQLIVSDREAVAGALELFRKSPALGFSDCLMVELARRAGNLPLGTFDRKLGRLQDVEPL